MAAINESVLEMHFHKPLMDMFRSTFGLGSSGQLNFYKYSQQKECFVGFDQAYVKTELGTDQFFSLLKTRAGTQGYNLNGDDFFFGYFLQFKVVQIMSTQSRHTPDVITSTPHYRVKLDTKRNMKTGLSQHELLYNLSRNKGAMVYYACPMLFDKAELYDIDVDIEKLKLADLTSCPSSYTDNESHFIFFDGQNSVPIWCSKPHEGKVESTESLITKIHRAFEKESAAESRARLLELLTDMKSLGISEESGTYWKDAFDRKRSNILGLAHDSLTVVRVRRDS